MSVICHRTQNVIGQRFNGLAYRLNRQFPLRWQKKKINGI